MGQIYNAIMQAYESGRNTSFSNKEMLALVKRFMPELFVTELQQIKRVAGRLASGVMARLAESCRGTHGKLEPCENMKSFAAQYPFIQFITLTDASGRLVQAVVTEESNAAKYGSLPEPGYDYSNRGWFQQPMQDGGLHITDVYQSQYTGALILSVSQAVTDESDEIVGVLCGDIQLEEILKYSENLEAEEENQESSKE